MRNLGSIDRIVRAVIGLAILLLFFVLEGNARYFALFGVVPLTVAALGYCPVYVPFGINTLHGRR